MSLLELQKVSSQVPCVLQLHAFFMTGELRLTVAFFPHFLDLISDDDSRFFKRSDRDRHMRSKHDSSTLVCSACTATFPDKGSLDLHCSQEHAKKGKFACSNCSLTYETAKALRGHLPKCRMVK